MMSAAVRSVVLGALSRPLYTLFANGEDGFLFGDWSELDELFTTSTGTTAVAADNNPVGLALDDRAWGARTLAQELAAKPEIVANGDFATGDLTNWTSNNSGTGTSVYSDGAVRLVGTSSGNRGYRYQLLPLVSGRTYRITWTGSTASGSCTIGISAAVDLSTEIFGALVGSGGSGIFTAGASNYLIIVTASSGGDVTVDNISVKEIPGNHALQSTSTQRAVYRTNNGKPYLSFDGSDDRLVTPFVPVTALTLAVAFNSATGDAVMIGGGDSAGSLRAFIGLSSLGYLGGGWGSQSFANIVATVGVDIRSQDHVGILVADASTVDLYLDGVIVYSGAASGTASGTTSPLALGCFNNGGTPASFSAMRDYAALALNRRATPAEIALITRQFQRTYQ